MMVLGGYFKKRAALQLDLPACFGTMCCHASIIVTNKEFKTAAVVLRQDCGTTQQHDTALWYM